MLRATSHTLESGRPEDDLRAFRRSLGHYATGVTIITASVEGIPVGVTVNSFASVSLDPPLILWSAAKTSKSLPIFQAAEGFAVNILSSGQADLAAHFARSGGDKFAAIEHGVGHHGAPILPGVAASFECSRVAEHPGGDHSIFVGKVERFARYARPLLAFAQGRYGIIIDEFNDAAEVRPLGLDATRHTFMTLLRRAFVSSSSIFKEDSGAVGLSVNESRVLYHLDFNSDSSLEELARASLLDTNSVDDALRSLGAQSLVQRKGDAGYQLTPDGEERLRELRRLISETEARRVRNLPDNSVRAAREVLEAFSMPATAN